MRKDGGMDWAMESVVRETAFILVNVCLGEGHDCHRGLSPHGL